MSIENIYNICIPDHTLFVHYYLLCVCLFVLHVLSKDWTKVYCVCSVIFVFHKHMTRKDPNKDVPSKLISVHIS